MGRTVKTAQVRRPAITYLTMLSRFEAIGYLYGSGIPVPVNYLYFLRHCEMGKRAFIKIY
jgi:hypothetical protein